MACLKGGHPKQTLLWQCCSHWLQASSCLPAPAVSDGTPRGCNITLVHRLPASGEEPPPSEDRVLPHTGNRSIFPEPHSPFLTRVEMSVSLFYAHFLNHWHSCLLFSPASHTSLHPGVPFPFLYSNYCDRSIFHPLPSLANLICYLCLHYISPFATTWGQLGAAEEGRGVRMARTFAPHLL